MAKPGGTFEFQYRWSSYVFNKFFVFLNVRSFTHKHNLEEHLGILLNQQTLRNVVFATSDGRGLFRPRHLEGTRTE